MSLKSNVTEAQNKVWLLEQEKKAAQATLDNIRRELSQKPKNMALKVSRKKWDGILKRKQHALTTARANLARAQEALRENQQISDDEFD